MMLDKATKFPYS